MLYRVAVALLRLPVRLAFRPQVRGLEHLPPRGGFVVASNHLSGFDVLAVAYALAPRVLRFMAKNQLFARRFLGPLIRRLGAFPAHGSEHRARGGTAYAALAGGVPLVPVALAGTDGWRRLRRWRIALGPTVRLDDLPGEVAA